MQYILTKMTTLDFYTFSNSDMLYVRDVLVPYNPTQISVHFMWCLFDVVGVHVQLSVKNSWLTGHSKYVMKQYTK